MDDQRAEPTEGGLLDVSGLNLQELKEVDESSLGQAILRVTGQQDSDAISGHQSAI